MSCKKCENETFTEVANSLTRCHRCRSCGRKYLVQIQLIYKHHNERFCNVKHLFYAVTTLLYKVRLGLGTKNSENIKI